MKYLCPLCGNVLATEDTFIYTCMNCDETFTSDELDEEYGIGSSCSSCHIGDTNKN